MVETNAEYPTDIRLLNDAMRGVIRKTARLLGSFKVPGWRQSHYNIQKVEKHYKQAQRSKKKSDSIKESTYKKYLEICQSYLNRSIENIEALYESHQKCLEPDEYLKFSSHIENIRELQTHAVRQIDQIRLRVIEGEEIPTASKVYSIYQPHTEWVVKGKAGVPVELGVKVCVIEDEYQFILTHRVMYQEQDVDVALPITQKAKQLFPELCSCSYDKGFHSPENQTNLAEELEHIVLPKKGKRNKQEREREASEYFKAQRKQHSAVESCINALEHHGLDRCPDVGREGFNRYISLGILARNIQQLGRVLTLQENKRNKKSKSPPAKKAA